MVRGKYQKVTPNRKKPAVLLLCLAMLLLFVAGGTLAYLMVSTPSVQNRFEAASVGCQVVDSNGGYAVKNTGDINAYIRATVVVTWMDSEGNILHTAPDGATDGLTYPAENWMQSNGIYYYKYSVAPDNTTGVLVSVGESELQGYKLRVDVIAEAIQAEGMGESSAEDAWNKAGEAQ